MASTGYINTPPSTDRDLQIVKGMLLASGVTFDVRDPALGVEFSPSRPEDHVFTTKGPRILTWLSTSMAIMILATGTRLYLRWYVPRLKWGPDDWIIIPGLCLAVVYAALQMAMVTYGGAGRHIYDVSYADYLMYHWLASVAEIVLFVCVGLVKVSITAFNMRLTSLWSRAYRITNWSFMAICGLYTVTALFFNIFKCFPAAAGFDLLAVARSGSPPTCVATSTMNTILRAVNIVCDCCLVAIPLSVIWEMQLSRANKLKLCVALGLAALACIGSVMALVSRFQLKEDVLWNYTGILGWSLVELTVGVVTASIPTLAFLLPSATSPTQSSLPPIRLEGISPAGETVSHPRSVWLARKQAARV